MKATIALFVLGVGSLSHANLIANGGFESNTVNTGFTGYYGDVADGWSSFDDVYSGSPDMWDNNGVDGNLPGTSSYMSGVLASEGTKFAAMASDNSGFSEGVESTRFSLTAGTQYILSLDLLHDGFNGFNRHDPAELTVRLRQGNGPANVLGLLAANTVPSTWEARSLTFSVNQTDTYSLILSSETFDGRRPYLGVDNVNLEAVPEPGTMAALGLGLAAIARRRKRT